MIHHAPTLRQPVPRRTVLAAAAALPAAGMLGACGQDQPVDAGQAPQRVTFSTGFGSNGRDGAPWVAKAKGYFADANLEVEIVPGAGAESNIQLLEADQAQFAIGDFAGLVVAYWEGHTQFTCIGAIQDRNLAAIMTRADIQAPQDLEGGTVALAQNTVTADLWPSWAEAVGVDPETVDIIWVEPPALPGALKRSEVDAIGQFVVAQQSVEATIGEPVTAWPYGDQLTDMVGQVLMTRPQLAADNADLCIRFRDALLRGLRYALDHPEEAGRLLNEAVPDTSADAAASEMELMRPYVVNLGELPRNHVGETITLLRGAGVIEDIPRIVPEDLVTFELVPGGGEES